jgi:hypothetical protein
MSRFGNERLPSAAGEPDVLHSWALIDHATPALTTFAVLERQLDEVAQRLGVVTVGAPTYETSLPTDHVPVEVRAAAAHVALVAPLWFVHAWVRFQARTHPAAAREVAELYGVPEAELDAALIGGAA